MNISSSSSWPSSESLRLYQSDEFSWDGISKYDPEAVISYVTRRPYTPRFLQAIKNEDHWQSLYLRYFARANEIPDPVQRQHTLDRLLDWLGDSVIEISAYLGLSQIRPDWIDNVSQIKNVRLNSFSRLKPTYDLLTVPEQSALIQFIKNQPKVAERFIDCNMTLWNCCMPFERNQIFNFLIEARSELLIARFMWAMSGYHHRVVHDLILCAQNNWEEKLLSLMRVSCSGTVKSLFGALGEYKLAFCAYLHLTSSMSSSLRERMDRLRAEYITAPVKLKSRLVVLALSNGANISKWAKNLIEQVHQGHTFDACANWWVDSYFSDEKSHGEFKRSQIAEISCNDVEILCSRSGEKSFLHMRVVDFVVAKLQVMNSASENMDPLQRARMFVWALKTQADRKQYLQSYDQAAIASWRGALSSVASESFIKLFDEALSIN